MQNARHTLTHLYAAIGSALRSDLGRSTFRSPRPRFTVLPNTPVGLYELSTAGTLTAANATLAQLLKYPSTDALQNVLLVDHRSDGGAQWRSLLERQGTVCGLESRWRCRDGNAVWLRETVQLEPDGTYRGVLDRTTTHAVTGRGTRLQRRATAALERASTAAEAIDGVLHAVCASLKWERGSFWQIDEKTDARKVRDWPSLRVTASHEPPVPDLQDEMFDGATLRTIAMDVEPSWHSARARKNDLSTRWRGAVAIPLALDGSRRAVMTFVTDEADPEHEVTETLRALGSLLGNFLERVRAQDAARCSRDALNAAIQSALDVVIITRADGSLLYGNPSTHGVLGRDPHDIVHLSLENLVRPEDLPRLSRAIADATRGISRFIEAHFLHQDGSWRVLEVIGSRVELPDEGSCILFNTRDVTARKQAERVLIQATEEAIDAARLKSEFVNNVSHELRTPLHGIFGMLEMLSDTSLDAEQREHAASALKCAQTLFALVEDLLDFGKLDARRIPLNRTALDLMELVKSVLAMTAAAAQAKNLGLSHRLSPDVPSTIAADADRLRQVLVIFVSNAVKFTERGEVKLAVEMIGTSSRPEIRIAVIDTGPGIRSSDLHLLFRPFGQVDGSMTRRHSGPGLGLAIAKRLVEAMGGEIGVESATSRGSVFWLTLPLPELPGRQPDES